MKKLALALLVAGLAVSGSGCIFVPVDDAPRGRHHHHGSFDSHPAPQPAPRSTEPRPEYNPRRR